MISIIVAMSNNNTIGINNELPWHLPEDLQHFKKLTLGKAIVMGRKTYESIGKPLPKRTNIVVTRNPDLQIDGCEVVTDLNSALELGRQTHEEVMLIGGSQLFEQAMPMIDRIYLTLIDKDVPGDTFFPEWDGTEWTISDEESHHSEKQSLNFTFKTLTRNL